MPESSSAHEHSQERANSVAVIVQMLNENWDVNVAPALAKRLDHLAKHSPTTADGMSALRYAGEIFDYVEAHAPERKYTADERRIVRVGTIFSDIGKTGPVNATPEAQELCVQIFAVENVPDRETLVLRDFFKKHLKRPWVSGLKYRFPGIWRRYLDRTARSLGIDPDTTTLQAFHNLHSLWTLRLLMQEESGIHKRSVPAAACHHRIRGDNPGDILAPDDTLIGDFGTSQRYGRAEKLVTALDIYDACRRRSEMTHDEAIAALTLAVHEGREGFYQNDSEFTEILGDIAVALADSEEI